MANKTACNENKLDSDVKYAKQSSMWTDCLSAKPSDSREIGRWIFKNNQFRRCSHAHTHKNATNRYYSLYHRVWFKMTFVFKPMIFINFIRFFFPQNIRHTQNNTHVRSCIQIVPLQASAVWHNHKTLTTLNWNSLSEIYHLFVHCCNHQAILSNPRKHLTAIHDKSH